MLAGAAAMELLIRLLENPRRRIASALLAVMLEFNKYSFKYFQTWPLQRMACRSRLDRHRPTLQHCPKLLQARPTTPMTLSASTAPSAAPFSKSPSMRAIWFVTWAKHMTGFCRASANA